mmetsp:Transcript_22082/g.69074  ORF Transcript_22082/g.69074 Transcript_22082/m.69074 type:complete len:205 (-) Transcript_22082:98-712(-)
MFGRERASHCVASQQGEPCRLSLWTRVCARASRSSLARTTWLASSEASVASSVAADANRSASTAWTSCDVLEPGAAQASSTRSPGPASRNNGGTIDTASCRVIVPASSCVFSHASSAAFAAIFRISFRPAPSRQPCSIHSSRDARPAPSVSTSAASPTSSASRRLASPGSAVTRSVTGSARRSVAIISANSASSATTRPTSWAL